MYLKSKESSNQNIYTAKTVYTLATLWAKNSQK